MKLKILLWVLAGFPMVATAQYGFITGKVYDRFGPLANVAVNIENSPYGTYTDDNGYYAFEIDTGFHNLNLKLPGYNETVITIELQNLDQKELDVEMESELMDADVATGTKTAVTQNQLESPVPIDVVYGHQLLSTGQVELAQALHQLLPSFYAVKQSIDDPINMVDPISLRGLGPDQILVLVNGKRRHKSAFLNIQDVFGRGTAGTDLNTIPLTAIDRVEVLRDGASSQYGSDAIGGVINIILKRQPSTPVISSYAGESMEGDGGIENIEFNYGMALKRKGFLNVTAAYNKQDAVNRGGAYSGRLFTSDTLERLPNLRDSVLSESPFPNNTAYELGSSSFQNGSFLVNARLELTDQFDFYGFGGVNYRLGSINGAFRYPVQSDQIVLLYHQWGFSPRINSELEDRSLNMGIDGHVGEWFLDVSFSTASSKFDVTVENFNNASLSILTPLSSFTGAYKYGHDIFGFDASREFQLGLGEIDLAFGGEFRQEQYDLIDGELESYQNGNLIDPMGNFIEDSTQWGTAATGMQGYFGVNESDALEEIRTNGSFYAELDYSLNKFLLSLAGRYEEYSDFGAQTTHKVATRYKFANQLTVRGSYNTGFKAPSLHQLYYQRTSTQPLNGAIQNVQLINSQTPIIGNFLPFVTVLQPETSESFSVGVTSNINRNISLSIDAYRTDIKDRIGLTSRIPIQAFRELGEGDPFLEELVEGVIDFYIANDVQFVELFTNLFDTRTRGFDAVLAAQYNFPRTAIHFNSSLSYMETEVLGVEGLDGETVEDNYRAEAVQIESFVPQYQWINNFSVTLNKINFTIGHVRYGETEFLHPRDNNPLNWELNENSGQVESRDQQFAAKDLFNFDVKYRFFNKLDMTIGALNVTNQYPDKLRHSENIRNGVFTYSPNVRQFDLRGAYFYTRLNFTF
ncbi:MAG: TonB-dependent receptor [Cytophagales bacterium]|nr:TonB-dependent receptor [Cytophagales bacterium]